MGAADSPEKLKQLPLHALHDLWGAKLAPYAGWKMPLSYPAGSLKEHNSCRAGAVLFDVSHMQPFVIEGKAVAKDLMRILPADLEALHPKRQCYSFFLNRKGGIIDDCLIQREPQSDAFWLVANAANATRVENHLCSHLPGTVRLEAEQGNVLLALQGPMSETLLEALIPGVSILRFQSFDYFQYSGETLRITRSGYTGEDGFEIAASPLAGEALALALTAKGKVQPAGLAARDSLRMEAALPLYGNELSVTTTPSEAGLGWAIPGRRRKHGGFPGFESLDFSNPPKMGPAGFLPESKAPLRPPGELTDEHGNFRGRITSAGYSPSLSRPIVMASVIRSEREVPLFAERRGQRVALKKTTLPFIPHRYKR